jgi:hypothetical protein
MVYLLTPFDKERGLSQRHFQRILFKFVRMVSRVFWWTWIEAWERERERERPTGLPRQILRHVEPREAETFQYLYLYL